VFWYDEVGEVIKQADGNKSSSADWFNFSFF
jgi:hypothetical protein